jgi:hypothetical protein
MRLNESGNWWLKVTTWVVAAKAHHERSMGPERGGTFKHTSDQEGKGFVYSFLRFFPAATNMDIPWNATTSRLSQTAHDGNSVKQLIVSSNPHAPQLNWIKPSMRLVSPKI